MKRQQGQVPGIATGSRPWGQAFRMPAHPAVGRGRQVGVLAFVAIALLVLTWGPGCYDFSGRLTKENERLLARKETLEREVRTGRSKFEERDRLEMERRSLEAQIEQFTYFLKKETGGGK